jgi:Tfp pilus assembly protein PilO
MNRLSKEKRNQLILAVLVTLLVTVGLWFTLIRFQQNGLERLNTDKATLENKLSQIRDTIKNSKRIEAELGEVSARLDTQEEDMASGDVYSWMVNFIRKFKQPYRVDIPQFTSGKGAESVNLLPKFPYKQVAVTIVGTAYYHDLGKFIADFENDYPASRVLNLDIAPASFQTPDEREKLSFRMDIVSLVKPATSRPANTP